MTQLGLFIAGAAAATAVNAAALTGILYLADEDQKLKWQHVAVGTGAALAADAAVIAPVLTGAATLEACRSRAPPR